MCTQTKEEMASTDITVQEQRTQTTTKTHIEYRLTRTLTDELSTSLSLISQIAVPRPRAGIRRCRSCPHS